jgi:hypothetical protein
MKLLRVSAALAVVIAAVGIACDGGTHVQGHIYDPAGKPVEDVRVTLTQASRSMYVTTAKDSRFVVGMLHSPFRVSLSLTAEKPGYEKFERRFSSADHLQTLDIILSVMH